MATDGLVINRARMTRGESKLLTVIGIRVQQAQRDGNADVVEAGLDALDRVLEKVIERIPDDWMLPDGVGVGVAGWIDHLTQDHYDEILEEMQARQPGEKKAQAGRCG